MNRLLTLVLACGLSVPALCNSFEPDPSKLRLMSANALVLDADAQRPIYAKAADEVTPIASLTKLMTAMVVLDASQPDEELIAIGTDDFDFLKGSRSRLRMGTMLPRRELLRLALMSSENRAASSLARHYPGGTPAFVAAMNAKAAALQMTNTHYVDATGLSADNVSTAKDTRLGDAQRVKHWLETGEASVPVSGAASQRYHGSFPPRRRDAVRITFSPHATRGGVYAVKLTQPKRQTKSAKHRV